LNLESIRLTSDDMWQSSLVTALITIILVAFLAWRIKRESFNQLRWPLAAAAGLFWAGYGLLLYQVFWDSYYRYFGANWMREGGILIVMVPVAAGMAFVFHWLARRLPGIPLVSFCFLGGLEGLLEHLWGIYGLKILDVPMLQGINPLSILAFAFPEYIFYWCVVIGIAVLIRMTGNAVKVLFFKFKSSENHL